MKMQVAPNMFIAQPRAQQKCGSVNRTARSHHSFAPHACALAAPRACFHANGRARLQANAFRSRLNVKPRTSILSIGQPSLDRGLFCSDRATEAAVTADFPLLAADHVSRHCRAMPP